jgi:hypothetical protein
MSCFSIWIASIVRKVAFRLIVDLESVLELCFRRVHAGLIYL